MKVLNCPKGHGPMVQKKVNKQKTFKGVDIAYMADVFVWGILRGTFSTFKYFKRIKKDASLLLLNLS